MCTAISAKADDHYFGRNLDYHFDFGEKIVITPRNYPFKFSNGTVLDRHYAIIGSAVVNRGYPLYFDGTNEMGLSVAGLNFPGYAKYNEKTDGKNNIASFEFIPYILCGCATTKEAQNVLSNASITNIAFDTDFQSTPLHWIVADSEMALVLEQTDKGVQVYENEPGVLTNSPPFDMQIVNLENYANLVPFNRKPEIFESLDFPFYSKGMGAIGLPGDCSSMSRFVRASFIKKCFRFGETERERVSSFFHILNSVYHIKGITRDKNELQMTHYSSCCNTDKGIYYYTTYYNCEINGVDMHRENLDSDKVIAYDFVRNTDINITN